MSSESEVKRLSKRLSYVLRHNPASIGLVLDDAGWVELDELVDRLRADGGLDVDPAQIAHVVETNDKRRFQLVDGRIRAAQGHSIDVDLGLEPQEPPKVLWHGTVERFLESIMGNGLVPGSRTHVHLSAEIETARTVGARRGRPVMLQVDAQAMHRDGHTFYRSANGVWLTANVPTQWIERVGMEQP